MVWQTRMVLAALVVVTLPATTAGCISPCTELEELCDECAGHDQDECDKHLDRCRFDDPDLGPGELSVEDDCCDEGLDRFDSRC